MVWIDASTRLIDDRGDDRAVVLTIRDITADILAQREASAQASLLQHRVLHDSLTGLGNRAKLMERMAAAMQRSAAQSTGCGLLVLDLDGFKPVNDALGHAVGDEVLVQLGVRLRSVLRTTDTAVRLGGDEFVVLCEDLSPATAENELGHVMQRIQTLLQEPYVTTGGTVEVGVSLGWSLSGPGAALGEGALERADHQMLDAKRRRKGLGPLPGPETNANSTPLATPPSTIASTPSEVRILIVDDDPGMRLLAARIIASSESVLTVVGEAADGPTAIDMIAMLRPDLVLCDVMMPEMSGPEVVTEVRRHDPDQAFVFWSATGVEELERLQASLGVPFLVKDRIDQLPITLLQIAARGPKLPAAQGCV